MAAKIFSSDVLRAKYKGCMIGALMGDCLGDTFNFETVIPKKALNDYFADLMSADSTYPKTMLYTDDSCMMISIAKSLVEQRELDAEDMAKRFVHEFFENPERAYGFFVVYVFQRLRDTNFTDVFAPAKQQFNGEGSFGNGGAMRIAPIALFGNNKGEEFVVSAAEECTRITHTHPNGVNGAILQCLAVNAALELDPSKELDPIDFLNSLLEKMEKIEKDTEKPYCTILEKMKSFFLEEEVSIKKIVEILGNGDDISAFRSVPVAIYSFLRGMKPLADYETSNPFMRTLYFSISVGGDTDTIACMACGIAGAYHGVELIPDILQKRCESVDEVSDLAEKLFDMTQKGE